MALVRHVVSGVAAVTLYLSLPSTANAQWTLESAIERALEVAPETRVADAEVAVRAGELKQAGSWPNPTVEVRADNKLGQEDRRGGSDFTQLVFSQPLPLRRLERERQVAQGRLASSEENRRFRRLQIEREIAEVFADVQLAQAKLDLARQRQAEIYPDSESTGRGRNRLVRYLTPFDRARLTILREEANQAVTIAEREHTQALAALRVRLALSPETSLAVTPLVSPPTPATLEPLRQEIENHPAIAAARRTHEAAIAQIDAAQSQRLADPALNVFHERDVLNDSRRNITGIGISVQIPLWNTNTGPVDRARAEAARAQAELDAQRRDVLARLQRSYTDLTRLRDQAAQVQGNLIEPARKLNDLARRSFNTGEVNVLALVDATGTYHDARARYLELLRQAQLAEAELRLASGRSVAAPPGSQR
jgi:cobalt-zinc-cadmium efflux system outer membrane protein